MNRDVATVYEMEQKCAVLQARIAELEKERTILRESNVDLIAREAETRVRAEAADKLAGDAVMALKELRDGVELPDRRCDPISVTGEHRFIIDRVLSSPAAEQARERAEATTALRNATRRYRQCGSLTTGLDGEQYIEAKCVEEVLDEALQRLDALSQQRSQT